ncbi:MAG: hypothetical protein IPO09_02280 [Anaeromyxobacter sp.]|nr:hypothetical protein [Anaeromyxobacter sp.]MBL0277549.1 hypothetical protein [Anaeromyxobacter sp.]
MADDTGDPMKAAGTAVADASQVTASPALLRDGRLSPRNRDTAEALARLDLHLSGLFTTGHELLQDLSNPGVCFFVAHAGRELANGLERILAGEDVGAAPAPTEEQVAENESNRARIASMLAVPPDHALVTAWFRVRRVFSASCHFGAKPSPSRLRQTYLDFSELLYGLVGPYFDTHSELDQLAAIENPDPEHVERARRLLLRPQQRRHFFSKLGHPGWLEPLARAGMFKSPPPLLVKPDGSWALQGWPEGQCLLRLAAAAPERVAEILLALPKENDNPAVASCVIGAAEKMPGPIASRLVPAVIAALKQETGFVVAADAIAFVRYLAREGQAAAFRLADALLWFRSVPGDARTEEPVSKRKPDNLLTKVETHELIEFVDSVVPALEALDAVSTIALLAQKLSRAVALGDALAGESAQHSGSTSSWCERVKSRSQRDDERETIAVALAGAAARTAEKAAENAQEVWSLLAGKHEIFERLRWSVLAGAGNHLRDELNDVVGGERLLDPPFGGAEAAALLRSQFVNASDEAKAVFQYALKRGPDANEARRMAAWRRDRESPLSSGQQGEISSDDIEAAVHDWQARRIRWFHDGIPPALLPLARQLSISPSVPSEERQALDEVGAFVGSATWVGADPSPRSPDELSRMAPDDLLSFLREWEGPAESFGERPSRSGLEDALATLAARDPGKGLNIVRRGVDARMAPGFLSALFVGLQRAGPEAEVSWDTLLAIATNVVVLASSPERPDPDAQQRWRHPWRLVTGTAIEMIRVGAHKNRIPTSLASMVWQFVSTVMESPQVWETAGNESRTTMDDVLSAALNSPSGSAAWALFEVALWDYRNGGDAQADSGRSESEHRLAVAARLAPLLDRLLGCDRTITHSALAMVGQYLPQLYLMVPEWVERNEETLLAGGLHDPVSNPTWGTYLLRGGFFDPVFRRLRPWYVRACESIPATNEGSTGDRRWSVPRALAEHVLLAVVRGLAKVGDSDALVESIFRRVSSESKSDVYFELFAAWSEPDSKVPPEFVSRLVAFWQWRLAELEATPRTPDSEKEADGLLNFLSSSYIPPQEAISLGRRTAILSSADEHSRPHAWNRLGELASADAAGAFEILELLVERELKARFPFLRLERIGPPLRAALECQDEKVRARAVHLVHRLGERGFEEFGALLHAGPEETAVAEVGPSGKT